MCAWPRGDVTTIRALTASFLNDFLLIWRRAGDGCGGYQGVVDHDGSMAVVNGTAGFDEVFGGLLQEACVLSGEALSLIGSLLPDGMTFATMPAASVQKLHLSATANYRAGLACLRSAETSVGAFALLRGVLEAWSHIAFIADSTEGGDARCRALRYERGALNEWEGNIHVPPPGVDKTVWEKAHDENAAEIERLWRESGCGRASARTRTHVDSTLKKLAKELPFDWMIPLWRSTSAVVHMYGSDFLFEDRSDGSSDLVWAQPRFRATWLSFLGASYAYLTTATAGVLDPSAGARERVARFHERMRSIVENDAVRKAVAGAFDL